MTGNIDKLFKAYNSHFFSSIKVFTLYCSEEHLRKRIKMRGITNENWISSSVSHNAYLKTHNKIGDVPFIVMDTDNKPPHKTAKCIFEWLNQK